MRPAERALSRTEVRSLTHCPACQAPRGELCRRTREHPVHGWDRISNHMERIDRAEQILDQRRQRAA